MSPLNSFSLRTKAYDLLSQSRCPARMQGCLIVDIWKNVKIIFTLPLLSFHSIINQPIFKLPSATIIYLVSYGIRSFLSLPHLLEAVPVPSLKADFPLLKLLRIILTSILSGFSLATFSNCSIAFCLSPRRSYTKPKE